jgi:HEAT repeat protein
VAAAVADCHNAKPFPVIQKVADLDGGSAQTAMNGMNDTLKTIAGFLEAGKPELQVASAQILGELRIKDASVVKALQASMRRSPVLGRFCLDALAKIQTEEAVAVVARTAVEMDALGDQAMHLVHELGAAAQTVLAQAFTGASLEQRARILGMLGKNVGRDAIPVFVSALLTPEMAELAARLLVAAQTQFTPALQKLLRDALHKHLGGALPEVCLAHVVAVLAAVDAEASRGFLLGLIGPETAPVVRSAAFRALQGGKLTAAQIRTMLDLLEDPAQKGVHDAVREVLAKVPEIPEGMLPVLKRLLAARQPEQRLFALRMLRTAPGAELAKIALKLLDHDDERFRAAAADALANNRQAFEPLLRLLLTTKAPGLAEACAAILVLQAPHLPPKTTRLVAEKALKLLGTNARLSDLLFDIVFAAGTARLVPFLVERCVRLRRTSRYADAMHVLARTASAVPADDEVRYQLAFTKLLHDAAQPAAENTPPGNSTMGFLAALVRNGFPVLERLRKESSMTPDLMLRVAQHFVAAVGPERKLATDLLQHLATRTKGRAGDEAKVALRAVGG